jgi:hypothetical protein
MKQLKQLKELIASSFLHLAPKDIEDIRDQFDGDKHFINCPILKELTNQAVEKIYKEFMIYEN